MGSANVHAVNDISFDSEVLKSNVPVLVDFTATWCGPCQSIAPILDQLADQYQGKIKVVKVDIDESQATARKYGIRGVPTLYMFKAGEMIAQHTGAAPKNILEQLMTRGL